MNDHMKTVMPDDDTGVQAFQELLSNVITSEPINCCSTVQFHEDATILEPGHRPGLVLGRAVAAATPAQGIVQSFFERRN